jgi:hypothetical protein
MTIMLCSARRIPSRLFSPELSLLRRGFHCNRSKMSFALYAQGRDPRYTLETTETERINRMLNQYGLQKWGFVIYRCTYEDDSAWDRFMHHLNARKDAILIETYDDEHLAQTLDWNVQQDSSSLNHATKDQVRDKFRAWVATDARLEMPTSAEHQQQTLEMLLYDNPRYKYCIHVDAESMQSVLDGPPPTEPDFHGVGYVNLIRADDCWEERDKGPAEYHDEREPELGGRTSFDVGWMKVPADRLVPEVYESLVDDFMWDCSYVRPNEGVWGR